MLVIIHLAISGRVREACGIVDLLKWKMTGMVCMYVRVGGMTALCNIGEREV